MKQRKILLMPRHSEKTVILPNQHHDERLNHRGIKYSRVDNAQAILSYISSGKTHESCMLRRKTVVHCSGIFLLNIQRAETKMKQLAEF
mgnify:CR=1 FL=1